MNRVPNLGELCALDDRRDAVHVAVVPAIAAHMLAPGMPVGLSTRGKRQTMGAGVTPLLGVVDPFLTVMVHEGDCFWLLLYPGTITSLRHEWSHPALDDCEVTAGASASDARAWISVFAGQIGKTYDEMMAVARAYVEGGDWTRDDSERHKDVADHQWAIFWRKYGEVTGTEYTPGNDFPPFTCAC